MGCHGNHEISYKQSAFIFEDNIFFLNLTGPIEQIYTRNYLSCVFNLRLITPLHTIVYQCFYPIFKITLIFMNMQMK